MAEEEQAEGPELFQVRGRCLPGWSLLDLAAKSGCFTRSDTQGFCEPEHMQPTVMKVLGAVAEHVGFAGCVVDTHKSAPLLRDPSARPDCILTAPGGGALVTWSSVLLPMEVSANLFGPSPSSLQLALVCLMLPCALLSPCSLMDGACHSAYKWNDNS